MKLTGPDRGGSRRPRFTAAVLAGFLLAVHAWSAEDLAPGDDSGQAGDERSPAVRRLDNLEAGGADASQVRAQVAALLRFLDAKGLNDPSNPLRLHEPIAPAAVDEALSRLSGTGVVTIIDPSRAATLAREVDDELPRTVGETGSAPVSIEVADTTSPGGAAAGRELRLEVENRSSDTVWDLSIHVIASIMQGPVGELGRPSGVRSTLEHVVRVVPGSLAAVPLGDLAPNGKAVARGDLGFDESPGESLHLYYLVLYRDGDGVLRGALPRPAGSAETASGDGASECLPRAPGTFVFTREPSCGWDDCATISGDHIAFSMAEGLANEDLDGDGDFTDSVIAVHRVGTGTTRVVDTGWAFRSDGEETSSPFMRTSGGGDAT